MSRYIWVNFRKTEGFPVVAACEAAHVSTSSYYEWEARLTTGPTDAEWDEAIVINAMWNIHNNVDDSVGSPRMVTELANRGFCLNHKRTERLMRVNGIYAVDGRRKKVKTTIPDKDAPPMPDLIKRNFAPGPPNIRCCGDITYIRTDEGWLYLADVLDLGSRRIIGYAMDEHMPTKLVSDALEMAIATRGGDVRGLIFHGDRGSQYMSNEYKELCEEYEILQSVGRTGSCHDNAAAESFWATLKRELISRYRFATRSDARRAIIAWINRYNAVRLHSTLGNVPPLEWELKYQQRQLLAA
jgi:putative transposase